MGSYEISELNKKEQEVLEKLNKIDTLEEKISNTYNDFREKKKELLELDKIISDKLGQVFNIKKAIEQMIKEKTQGFPWLAKAISDYFYMKSGKVSDYLMHKKHPAVRSAEIVKEQSRIRREAEKKFRITKYLLEYYEKLFPWLVDFKGEDLDDYIESHLNKPQPDETTDPVMRYVTKGEWEKLTPSERNQKALDRYWQRRKAKWQIGRDYERYIGYLYEKDGYSVYYQGIIEGFYDLGRDLIAKKDGETCIVQCKCWSKEKTIHEKHIMMLYGTVIEYGIKNKVNLIMDQQYDKTLIEKERNECYVETVAEAEKLGFRRAFRWQGENKNE